MVGGSTTEFDAAKPILVRLYLRIVFNQLAILRSQEHMGKNIVHCGDGSCGQVAKVYQHFHHIGLYLL